MVVWSVVVPQAVAYTQIAGLPPQAGLMAAPGALVGYALLGTSRTLVVGATTATAALSASAVGPLANGDRSDSSNSRQRSHSSPRWCSCARGCSGSARSPT